MSEFVLGTRGSALALRQTELVIESLRAAFPALALRWEVIRTVGDRHPQTHLEQLPGIGFFVKELEVALLAGEIDAAVHSMKDLPSVATDGLAIAAIPQREDPSDVLVARDGLTLDGLPSGARIGTSSPRRAALLLGRRPDVQVVPIRGNVETRIRKVDAGEVDAVCLAAAGLRRIGLATRITHWLPLDVALPAPGQGALGVQVRAADERARSVAAAADHPPSRYAVDAERALLRRLEAGCRLPVGAYAQAEGDRLTLRASVASPDGRRQITGTRVGTVGEREVVGTGLADELLARGAAKLIAGVVSEVT